MDKRRSLLNVSVSIFFKILLLFLALLTRRFLIRFLGNEVNGINSLYTSIIGFLSVAELGIGTAITFCMYEPIAKNEIPKVAALYRLFVKIYTIIGIIILVLGLCLLPAIPYLAKDYTIDSNIYITFAIMLLSVVLSYMYSAKTSLINAYKNNYISTIILSIATVIQQVLQILVLFIFQSFELYLFCMVISVLIQWILTEIYVRKQYKEIIFLKEKLDSNTAQKVVRSTKAMFAHKLGSLLVNTADSIIISYFLGVVLLGKYSNYTTIMVSMTSVLSLFFTSLTSIIGHFCVTENIEQVHKYFNIFFSLNFIIGCIFFLGYYAVIDDVVQICFGDNLSLTKDISFVITLNYFIQFMRQVVLVFRDATGTFYNDRFKPVLEGIVNIILSILLVNFIGIVGVIVATIITNLLICHIIEPFVLYKYALLDSPKKYYIKLYFFILVFVVLLVLDNYILCNLQNSWMDILVNGFIAVAIAAIPSVLIYFIDSDFKIFINNNILKIWRKLQRYN